MSPTNERLATENDDEISLESIRDGERRLEGGTEQGRTGFDPYHQWLGIPAAHQPPHLYRLIGVSPFERDPDVIATAAQIRMTYLDRRASEENREQARLLHSEVRAAMELLLDPRKRSAYEEELAGEWKLELRDGIAFDALPSSEPPKTNAVPPVAAQQPPPLTKTSAAPPAPLPPHLKPAMPAPSAAEKGPTVAGAKAPLPPHLQAAPTQLAPATPSPQTNASAASASTSAEPESKADVTQANGDFGISRPLGARKVSKRSRWIAALLVALAFLPIHALLGYIGYRLANAPPPVQNTSASSVDVASQDPDARLPLAPEAGAALDFVPAGHVEWPNVKRWWSRLDRGTIEAWITVPRTAGFVPLFGIYSDISTPSTAPPISNASAEPDSSTSSNPASSISGTRGWNGWVLGLDRTAQETGYRLVVRRRWQESEEKPYEWAIDWPIESQSPRHLALVLEGARATMLLDGERVGDLPVGELLRGVRDDASLWIGAGAALHEPGSWRGKLLELRVSDSAREFEALGARAGWRTDDRTLLLFDRSVQSATGSGQARDASRRQLVGELRQVKWSSWNP